MATVFLEFNGKSSFLLLCEAFKIKKKMIFTLFVAFNFHFYLLGGGNYAKISSRLLYLLNFFWREISVCCDKKIIKFVWKCKKKHRYMWHDFERFIINIVIIVVIIIAIRIIINNNIVYVVVKVPFFIFNLYTLFKTNIIVGVNK